MPLHDIRSIYMPYVIEKQPDGRYAILNREYKPVGFATGEHVAYANYPVTVTFKRKLTEATAKKLSFEGNPNTDTIQLYNDGCVPTHSPAHMKAYLERLAVLAKLEVETKVNGSPA